MNTALGRWSSRLRISHFFIIKSCSALALYLSTSLKSAFQISCGLVKKALIKIHAAYRPNVALAHTIMGGDLGGTVPLKFEVGDGPCIRPPNISRSSVMGCAGKYEVLKKM